MLHSDTPAYVWQSLVRLDFVGYDKKHGPKFFKHGLNKYKKLLLSQHLLVPSDLFPCTIIQC